MSYYVSKKVHIPFEKAVEKIKEELKKEGFGILTEIDVKSTLKKKLNVEFRNYVILGACNPPFAYRALKAEDKIGLMLPCNVIVQEISNNSSEVAAIDPIAAMKAVDNPKLENVSKEVQCKLKNAIDNM